MYKTVKTHRTARCFMLHASCSLSYQLILLTRLLTSLSSCCSTAGFVCMVC